MAKKYTPIKQDSFPLKVELLEDNPFGKSIVVNNIKLSVGSPIIVYNQNELNKYEVVLKYITLTPIIQSDESLDYDNINDDMSSSSDK